MKLLPLVLATAVTAVGMTTAQAASTHIDKIKSTGEVTLGFRESSIPFSSLDDNQKPIGYSMDICHNIVDAIKTELKMPDLKTTLVSVKSSTRIPLFATGPIALDSCSATNNTQ